MTLTPSAPPHSPMPACAPPRRCPRALHGNCSRAWASSWAGSSAIPRETSPATSSRIGLPAAPSRLVGRLGRLGRSWREREDPGRIHATRYTPSRPHRNRMTTRPRSSTSRGRSLIPTPAPAIRTTPGSQDSGVVVCCKRPCSGTDAHGRAFWRLPGPATSRRRSKKLVRIRTSSPIDSSEISTASS